MEEIKQLARALMNKSTYKDRHDLLENMLDYMSFEFSVCYSLLVKEIRKREMQSNNPILITKWMNTSTENSIIKLHESLLLVKRHNIIAKERHIENVLCMFYQTIERGKNTNAALKICNTIRDSKHLEDVYE